MVVSCASCGKKYKLTEEHFKGRDRITMRCPNCGKPMEATREEAPPAAQPPAPLTQPAHSEDTGTTADGPEVESLSMIEGKRASLAILQGHDAGTIFPITQPLVVIGRTGADLALGDSEVSRRHAQIELKGTVVMLRDLHSTNGTYVNEQRVTLQPIENQAEFRIGSTTLMLILTEDET